MLHLSAERHWPRQLPTFAPRCALTLQSKRLPMHDGRPRDACLLSKERRSSLIGEIISGVPIFCFVKSVTKASPTCHHRCFVTVA